MTDDASVAACVGAILAAEGRIDAVVNNAGLVMAGAVEDTAIDEARRTFETNVLGAIRVAKAVLPAMRARKSGVIVNMGSLAGKVGMPFQGLYSASKFALEGLTEALRQEVAGKASACRSWRPAIRRPPSSTTGFVLWDRPIPPRPTARISPASLPCTRRTSVPARRLRASRRSSPRSSRGAGPVRDTRSDRSPSA